MISIINFSKSFGDIKSVINLSLEVNKGEIYGFLGPNGAGKSTTIKTLVGIYTRESGTFKIGGYDVEDIRAKKITGYIPDEPYVYERLNARQYLEFFADIYRIDDKVRETKIQKAINTFSIDEDSRTQVQDFSRGSKQKLLISAVLMHEPQVLIIDEPMVGLDPSSTVKMIQLLKEFSKKGGTIFLSTHTLSVATQICDRIGIIDNGELKAEGTLQDLEKITQEKSLEEVFLKLTSKI